MKRITDRNLSIPKIVLAAHLFQAMVEEIFGVTQYHIYSATDARNKYWRMLPQQTLALAAPDLLRQASETTLRREADELYSCHKMVTYKNTIYAIVSFSGSQMIFVLHPEKRVERSEHFGGK